MDAQKKGTNPARRSATPASGRRGKKRRMTKAARAARRRAVRRVWTVLFALLAAGAAALAIALDHPIHRPILAGLAGLCALLTALSILLRKYKVSALLPFVLAAGLLAGLLIEATNVKINDTVYSVFIQSLDLTEQIPEDLSPLKRLSHLETLDARGRAMSTEALAELQEARPLCKIQYSIEVDGALYDADATTDLAYKGTLADMGVLTRFPNLKSVDLESADMTGAEKSRAREQYPSIDFSWSETISGVQYDSHATQVDMSGQAPDNLGVLTDSLDGLPDMKRLDVRNTGLINQDLLNLRARYPEASVLCTVNMGDTALDGATEELVLDGLNVPDLDVFIQELSLFDHLTRVSLKGSNLSNEQMETLMARFPETKFVWVVKIAVWQLPTDAKIFSGDLYPQTRDNHGRYSSQDYDALKYCTDLVALDLGHNKLTSLDFLAGLTKMKVLILVDNDITDISVMKNMPEMIYTELFLNDIADLTPLSGLTKLTDLNLYGNPMVKDVTPLYGLTSLERLWFGYSNLSKAQISGLTAALPNCRHSYVSKGATRDGWRDSPKYDTLKQIFYEGKLPEGW